MIPKIIHYCWFGDAELPQEYKSYIKGWKDLHPDWELKKWNETNSPMEIPYLKKAFAQGKWANLSNLLRFYALQQFGGIYLDTDIKVIKKLDVLLDNKCFLGFEEGKEDSTEFWVNNAIIGATKNHPFIQLCFEQIQERFDGTEDANLSAPRIVTELLKEKYGLNQYGFQILDDVTLYPTDFFYPIHYNEIYKVKEIEKNISKDTIAVHIWGRSWLSKDTILDMHDSLLQQLNHKTNELIMANETLNETKEKGIEQEKDIISLNKKVDTIKDNIDKLFVEQKNLIQDDLNNKKEQELKTDQLQNEINEFKQTITKTLQLKEEFLTVKAILEKVGQKAEEREEQHFKSISTLIEKEAILKTTLSQQKNLNGELTETIRKQISELTELKKLIKLQKETYTNKLLILKNQEIENQQKLHKEQLENHKGYTEKISELLLLKQQHEVQLMSLQKKNEQILSKIAFEKDEAKKQREIENQRNKEIFQKELAEKENELVHKLTKQTKQIEHIENENKHLIKEIDDLKDQLFFEKKEKNNLLENLNVFNQKSEEHQNQINSLKSNIENKNKEIIHFLQEEVQRKKASIIWYQETFEKRKLIGILKDRLKKTFL